MRIYYRFKDFLENKIYSIKHWFEIRRCKILYNDYTEDDEYNCGTLKHIWGIKSYDDLSKSNACLYTMNDIDITYDRKSKLYMLRIETAYLFDDKKHECEYLRRLLSEFTTFMNEKEYSKETKFALSFNTPSIYTSAESIEELYTNFRIFVEGFCAIYGK